jgi:hypothetical protein
MDERNVSVTPHQWLDYCGVTLAVACAIQCAALPLLISLVSFQTLIGLLAFAGPALVLSGSFETLFMAVAIAVATGSFLWGFSHHRRWYIFLFPAGAIASVLTARLVPGTSHQIPLVVAGALLLAAGHVLYRRLCRVYATCAETTRLPARHKGTEGG